MKRFLKRIVPFILVTVLFIGIIQLFPFSTRQKSLAVTQKSRIAVILQYAEKLTYWKTVWRGIDDLAGKYEIEISAYQFRSRSQIEELFELALLGNPDGIIFCAPSEPSDTFKKLALQAKSKGIPLVCMDTDAGGEYRDVFISADDKQCGKMLAQQAVNSLLPGQSILMVKYHNTPSVSIMTRQEEFLGELAAYGYESRVKTFDFIYGDKTGQNIMELQELLASKSHSDLIVSFGPGCTQAIAPIVAKLKTDKTLMLAVGESKEIINYVTQDVIQCLFALDCDQVADMLLYAVCTLMKGEKPEAEQHYGFVEITPETAEENKLANRIMEAQ